MTILDITNAAGKTLFRCIELQGHPGTIIPVAARSRKELARLIVIFRPLISLDSFVSQEEHPVGRKQATRNVHLMSKGRSMTPPPQIQPR